MYGSCRALNFLLNIQIFRHCLTNEKTDNTVTFKAIIYTQFVVSKGISGSPTLAIFFYSKIFELRILKSIVELTNQNIQQLRRKLSQKTNMKS